MQEPAAPNSNISRALQMALAAVIGLAVVGFVVGIRQGTTPPDLTPPPRVPPEPQPDAIAAIAYRDFDRRTHGPNRDWRNSLADLAQPPDNLTEVERDRELLEVVLAARSARRAFDGAPPVVPHPIDQMSTSSCLACHQDGIWIGRGVRAPKMSHALYHNCTQCHVEQQASELPAMAMVDNSFVGQAAPHGGGARAWDGAPPVVPHPIWMRENCLSCHGPGGASPMRTTHPARANCLQCNAPSAVLDQWAADDEPPWFATASQPDADGASGAP